QPAGEAVLSARHARRRPDSYVQRAGDSGDLLVLTDIRPLFAGCVALFAIVLTGWLRVDAAPARRGTIRGRVDVRRTAPGIERRPAVAELSTPESAAPHEVVDRPSVVYLESAPRGAFEQSEPGHAVMDQRNETFVPHVLAITTGTTVDFPNSDRIYHNV